MGCGSPEEKIRNEILALKLKRIGLRMERKENLKMLFDNIGKVPAFSPIPDYIDHRFARKRGLIEKDIQPTSINFYENTKRASSVRKKSKKSHSLKRKSSKNLLRRQRNKRNTE